MTDALAWESFDIPDGSEPAQVFRLRVEPGTKAITLLVRFPAGWNRMVPGYYEAAEDVLFLEGELEINGVTYRNGDWAYFPAGSVRRAMASPNGAFALARFGGAARWVRSEVSAGAEKPRRVRLEPVGDRAPSPLGAGLGWILRSAAREQTWFTEPPAEGARAKHATELFDIALRVWSWIPAGEPLPAASGLCFARIFS